MSKSEKGWLRKSVILGIATATVLVVAMVLVAGATSAVSFAGNSLTGMTNSTLWNAATSFSGLEMTVLLVPLLVAFALVALVLAWITLRSAGRAGY